MENHQVKPSPLVTPCNGCAEKINRRRALMAVSIGLGLVPGALLGQTEAASSAPQAGDFLTGLTGNGQNLIRPEDIVIGALPMGAWPVSEAGIVRNQNRLNELLLIRLDPATLNAEIRSISADGILAFSALCSHAGCTITDWILSRNVLACDCHSSEFDPRQGGKAVDGPASRPLPPLPLKLIDGKLAVAKTFNVAIRFDA